MVSIPCPVGRCLYGQQPAHRSLTSHSDLKENPNKLFSMGKAFINYRQPLGLDQQRIRTVHSRTVLKSGPVIPVH